MCFSLLNDTINISHTQTIVFSHIHNRNFTFLPLCHQLPTNSIQIKGQPRGETVGVKKYLNLLVEECVYVEETR